MENLEGVDMTIPMRCTVMESCANCPLKGPHYNSSCTALLAKEVDRLRRELSKRNFKDGMAVKGGSF